jgi:hypothetical protein
LDGRCAILRAKTTERWGTMGWDPGNWFIVVFWWFDDVNVQKMVIVTNGYQKWLPQNGYHKMVTRKWF